MERVSEKVKVTQEQADAIEERKRINMLDESVKCHIKYKWEGKTSKSLNKLNLDEFIRALYIGYEVEPEFKVGDWIARRNLATDKIIITQIEKIEGDHIWADFLKEYGLTWTTSKEVRHATSEEIWWEKHGRDVWELKTYDLLMNRGGTVFEVENAQEDVELWEIQRPTQGKRRPFDYIKRNYKVICLAEDRKDV